MKSTRTKDVKKLCWIFRLSSALCWIGVALFAIIATFSTIAGYEKSGIDILSEMIKTKLIAFSMTTIIGLIVALLIKEKARITIYMLSVVILSILYGETAMYITLAIWAVDEYVLHALSKHYKTLITINQEMDRRG